MTVFSSVVDAYRVQWVWPAWGLGRFVGREPCSVSEPEKALHLLV
jgi:hypothetical protein